MADNSLLDIDNASLNDRSQREAHRERLSAMMDGMLSTDESRFLLRRMQHDAELAGSWERWQLYGDAMRGQTGNALPADFSRRVARAIAVEIETDRATRAGSLEDAAASGAAIAWRRRLRWGGGAALAASVVIAALIATRNLSDDPSPASQPQTAVAAAQPAAAIVPAPEVAAFTVVPAVVDATASETIAGQTIVVSPNKLPRQMASVASLSSDESTPLAAAASTQQVVASVARVDARGRRDTRGSSRTRDARVVAAAGNSDAANPTTDPFGRQTLEISTKPWPRALMPETASVGGQTVDYSVGATPGMHPLFQPRIETQAASPPASDAGSSAVESPTP